MQRVRRLHRACAFASTWHCTHQAFVACRACSHLGSLESSSPWFCWGLFGQAQGLRAIITTAGKLASSDHRLYMLVDTNRALGLLKVGQKKLFIRVRHRRRQCVHPTHQAALTACLCVSVYLCGCVCVCVCVCVWLCDCVTV